MKSLEEMLHKWKTTIVEYKIKGRQSYIWYVATIKEDLTEKD